MALKPCRECGAQVSTEAEVCPHCGVRSPTATDPLAALAPSGNKQGGFQFERKHHLTTLERMVRWQEIAYD